MINIVSKIEAKALECVSLQNVIIGYLHNLEVNQSPQEIETVLKVSQYKMKEVLILLEKLGEAKEALSSST